MDSPHVSSCTIQSIQPQGGKTGSTRQNNTNTTFCDTMYYRLDVWPLVGHQVGTWIGGWLRTAPRKLRRANTGELHSITCWNTPTVLASSCILGRISAMLRPLCCAGTPCTTPQESPLPIFSRVRVLSQLDTKLSQTSSHCSDSRNQSHRI